MMQIGGVDNLVLKQVNFPSENETEEKKVSAVANEAKTDTADRKIEAKPEEKEDEAARSVYGDVVGKSSDGDTTRVKKDAMEAYEAGLVFQKEEKEDNLMEFNRDQLAVMRDQYDITENAYNHEILRRDEIQEKAEESAFAKSNKEMIEKQKEEATEKAQEKAKERLEEMQGKGTEDENAARLENGMNILAGAEKGLLIEEDAVQKAAENNRSEIIDQILNPDDGNLKVIIK